MMTALAGIWTGCTGDTADAADARGDGDIVLDGSDDLDAHAEDDAHDSGAPEVEETVVQDTMALDGTPGGDGDGDGDGDEDGAAGYDFMAFAAKVDSAWAASGRTQHCAAAIAAAPATDTEELRRAVGDQLLSLGGGEKASGTSQGCGGGDQARCANIFEFYVTATDGTLAAALKPCAEELELVCKPEVVLWQVEAGASGPAADWDAVSMACVHQGRALGLVYIEGLARCSTFDDGAR